MEHLQTRACVCNNSVDTAAIAPALRSAHACIRRSARAAPEAHSSGASTPNAPWVSGVGGTSSSRHLPQVRAEQIQPHSQDALSATETAPGGEESGSPALGAQTSQASRITEYGESGPMMSPKVTEQGNPALNGQQREVLPRPPKPSWLMEAQDEVGWHTNSDPEHDPWG